MREIGWADFFARARRRFMYFLVMLFAGFSLFWFLADDIIERIKGDILPGSAKMIATSPLEYVVVRLEISLVLAVLIALPVFFAMVLQRLEIEVKVAQLIPWAIAALALLSLGFTFTYLLLLPITMKVLTSFTSEAGVLPYYSINEFVIFVFITTIIFSLVFELPLVLSWLAIRGYVSTETLAERRKEVYIGIFIVAAVITADPTPLSQVLLSVPLIILYEASIISAKIFGKKSVEATQ